LEHESHPCIDPFLASRRTPPVIYVDSSAASTTKQFRSRHRKPNVPFTSQPGLGTALAGVRLDFLRLGPAIISDPGLLQPRRRRAGNLHDNVFFSPEAITAANPESHGGRLHLGRSETDTFLATAKSKPGSTCSNTPIGCQASTEAVFSFASLAPYLEGRHQQPFRSACSKSAARLRPRFRGQRDRHDGDAGACPSRHRRRGIIGALGATVATINSHRPIC